MVYRTLVITGASDGIGAVAARRLAERGDEVVVVGRVPTKTKAVADEIGMPHHVADFSRLDDVRRLAEELGRYPRIDVLANNAGGLMGAREMTADGFEKTFQVNHLAPFLLTHLLMDQLASSNAKVVNTSSGGARLFGLIDLDDLDNAREYKPTKAYGDSKLANILFTKELDRRHRGDGIDTVAFHPGNLRTNFSANSTSVMKAVYRSPLKYVALAPAGKGAELMLWHIDGVPEQDWQPGEYYERRKVARTNPQAHDPVLAEGLWERSAEMLGVDAA